MLTLPPELRWFLAIIFLAALHRVSFGAWCAHVRAAERTLTLQEYRSRWGREGMERKKEAWLATVMHRSISLLLYMAIQSAVLPSSHLYGLHKPDNASWINHRVHFLL